MYSLLSFLYCCHPYLQLLWVIIWWLCYRFSFVPLFIALLAFLLIFSCVGGVGVSWPVYYFYCSFNEELVLLHALPFIYFFFYFLCILYFSLLHLYSEVLSAPHLFCPRKIGRDQPHDPSCCSYSGYYLLLILALCLCFLSMSSLLADIFDVSYLHLCGVNPSLLSGPIYHCDTEF